MRLVRVLTGDIKKVKKEDVIFTYGVDSCVAVLIKLKDESKICIHFGFDNSENNSFNYQEFIDKIKNTIDKGFMVYNDSISTPNKRNSLISYFKNTQNYKKIEMIPELNKQKKEYDSLYCNDDSITFGKTTKDLMDILEKKFNSLADYKNYFNKDGAINVNDDYYTECNEGERKAAIV